MGPGGGTGALRQIHHVRADLRVVLFVVCARDHDRNYSSTDARVMCLVDALVVLGCLAREPPIGTLVRNWDDELGGVGVPVMVLYCRWIAGGHARAVAP